jgi:hypothetical protein
MQADRSNQIQRQVAFALKIARPLAGAMFGAGMASIAKAAAPGSPAFGPHAVIAFGVEVPVLSALFGLIGVVLARRVAPATDAGAKLGPGGNAALTALLALGVLALIVTGEKRPIVALGWSVGLGYSGLAFIEMVARGVMTGSRVAIETFSKVIVALAEARQGKGGGDGR